MVRASSNQDSKVLDLFSGSGTTLRVCQQLNRNCDGIEINPRYVEMVKIRLMKKFNGFDSIDPRMRRVPNDLRDKAIRDNYVNNHVKWFLDKHENDVVEFLKALEEKYPEDENLKKKEKKQSLLKLDLSQDLFSANCSE